MRGLIVFVLIISFPAAAAAYVKTEGKRYFDAGPVTEAIPGMFVKLSIIYAVLAAIGVSLLRDPTYQKIRDDDVAAAAASRTGGAGGDGRQTVESGGGGSGGSRDVVSIDKSPLRRRLCDLPEGDYDDINDHSYVREVKPMELIRMPQAWHVSIAFMLGAIGGLVTLATYKSFGIVNFTDDHFMSMIVSTFEKKRCQA